MIYHICLFLFYVILAPKLIWERVKGKKHPAFLQRLGFSLPKAPLKKVIWIHACSVGEGKAAVPFFQVLKEQYPDAWFCVSTTTATGSDEVKRSLCPDFLFYLPIDFTWVVRRFVKQIHPDIFFLIEGDVWPNLLKALKKGGCKTFLISAKLSTRSFSRMRFFPKISQRLFSDIDLICAQTEEYASRFSPFAKGRVCVTGNLKFDMRAQEIKVDEMGPFLTISSTHHTEEELLLDQLKDGPWSLFLAPRHPERVKEVAALLTKKNISYALMSEQEKKQAKVILVDRMGNLGHCYAHSLLAIVGGSFVPGIGGHNILEPALYGCPSLFGPYTEKQNEMVQKVLDEKAGIETSLQTILQDVQRILNAREEFSQRSSQMIANLRGSSMRTLSKVRETSR